MTMKFFKLLLLLAFLPGCATYLTVEENKSASKKGEEPMLDIEKAVVTDVQLMSELLSALGDTPPPPNRPPMALRR